MGVSLFVLLLWGRGRKTREDGRKKRERGRRQSRTNRESEARERREHQTSRSTRRTEEREDEKRGNRTVIDYNKKRLEQPKKTRKTIWKKHTQKREPETAWAER